MQHVPAFAIVAIAIKLLVTGNAPYVGSHVVLLFQYALCLQNFIHDRAAAKQLRALFGIFLFRDLKPVHAFQNAFADFLPLRHLRHRHRLIRHGQIVEDRLLINVHALNAVLNDDGKLIGERWIVRQKVGNRESQHMAVPILVLQTFACQRSSARSSSKQEAASTHISGGPDQIANPLKPKH